MQYWTGTKAAIDAANEAAFADYIAKTPTSTMIPSGEIIPNTTKRWADPMQDAAGVWFIPVYDGIEVPEGCEVVEGLAFGEGQELPTLPTELPTAQDARAGNIEIIH